MNFPLFQQLQERDFADLAPKNKWIEKFKRGELKDIKENLFILVDGAYAPLGGHPRVPNPDAVLNSKTSFWMAADVDNDPEADSVIFGSKRNGIKIAGFGHDGKGGKKAVIQQMIKVLNRPGFWVEASLKPAEIFVASKKVPFLTNQEDVEKIFGPVDWLGNPGWYTRKLDNKDVRGKRTEQEMVFGKPKL